MEFSQNFELFNKPIIHENNYFLSNHKIFEKYTSSLYQKYSFDLLETLCKKSSFENKDKILHKSIYFLLKFLYKSRNNILISNYDIIILICFYLGVKTIENQTKIPNIKQLINIYKEKFGDYQNEEIKIAEIIIIKKLQYKINFMTAYDYLFYLFQDSKEYLEYPKKNLETIIKEQTKYFCLLSPISIVQECIKNIEKNKLYKYPIIIKKRMIQHQKNNRLFFNLGSNIDESLSTSISSGHYNNNHSNDFITSYVNYKDNKKKSPLNNIINKYMDISIDNKYCEDNEDNEDNHLNYLYTSNKKNNNITINNNHFDYEKFSDNFTYNKKNIKNLKQIKNVTRNKDYKNEKDITYKINIKEKIFQRNNILKNKIKYNLTIDKTNKNIIYSRNNLYTKPYLKKEESKGCFTSNKKKDNVVKYKYFNIINKNNKDVDYKCSLKKKLLFDENEFCLNYQIE